MNSNFSLQNAQTKVSQTNELECVRILATLLSLHYSINGHAMNVQRPERLKRLITF
uniref:Uncharacterized protein n=1 Tax=Rhizophora mucronata TaxID=61149 RepID=A0A2P2NAL8_RHIMU